MSVDVTRIAMVETPCAAVDEGETEPLHPSPGPPYCSPGAGPHIPGAGMPSSLPEPQRGKRKRGTQLSLGRACHPDPQSQKHKPAGRSHAYIYPQHSY